MTEIQNQKQYDLEERTLKFAQNCRDFIKNNLTTVAHIEYGKQLIRSSSSPAANYIEANESFSRRDFIYKIKICRKEMKESRLWIRLFEVDGSQLLQSKKQILIAESLELTKIFGAILEKCK